jgi:hypothetical protein
MSVGIPQQYVGRLLEQEIHTMQDVLLMTEHDMIDILNLPIGVKNRILHLQS